MREILPPLFQIGTGLAFLLVLIVGLGARQAIKRPGLRMVGLGLVGVPAGMFFLSRATDASSIGAGGSMFIAAGIAFLATGLLVAIGLVVEARQATVGPAGAS